MRLEIALTAFLVLAGTIRACAQDEPRSEFSAQGPGATGQAQSASRSEILFSKGGSDAEADGRPPLPDGLRNQAAEAATEQLPTPPQVQEPVFSPPVAAAAQPAAPEASPGAAVVPRLPLKSPDESAAVEDVDKLPNWLALNTSQSISSVLGGLSVVLGTFLLLVWAVRKRMPKRSARLPDEIIEVLGRTTLATKQSLHLIRVGGKLIVVSVTATGTETLTEITDPGEVTRILAACQRHHVHSSTSDFRKVFEQLGSEPAKGFLGG